MASRGVTTEQVFEFRSRLHGRLVMQARNIKDPYFLKPMFLFTLDTEWLYTVPGKGPDNKRR